MKINQIYTGCLAQGAYYIESNGEAAIVDPLREVNSYIALAKERGTAIKYIFETHFHADFVSGHLTLAEETGADIIFGPNANPSYEAVIAKDNQIFKLGNIQIKVLHTPGHTMESTTFLVLDENGNEHAIFSGDTLFLGDVGRPDLAQKAADMTQEELAGTLFDSLRTKIMTLPEEVIVYPGHGAGSACGKNMSKETVGSIGHELQNNYALRGDMTKEEFVKEVTDGLTTPPGYFPFNVKMNKEGYVPVKEVMQDAQKGWSPDAFEAAAEETGALVLDVRNHNDFVKGFVPRSISIGLNGGFAPWVGELVVDVQQPLLLVVEEDQLDEAVTRLARVGFDNIKGYLKGGVEAWAEAGKELDSITSISAEDLAAKMKLDSLHVFDVRNEGEYLSEHVVGAEHTSLKVLSNQLSAYNDKLAYVHCAGGYRSVIAASILKAKGYHDIVNVEGGFGAIKETEIPVSEYVCPSTL